MSTLTNTIALNGIDPQLITCEMDKTDGIGIHLIGMQDAASRECLLRSITAMQASGHLVSGKKLVITLGPATVRKAGSAYDLAVATLIVSARRDLDKERLSRLLVLGELGLDGSVRTVNGVVQAVKTARDLGFLGVVIPRGNLEEVSDVFQGDLGGVYAVSTLNEALRVIDGDVEGLGAQDIVGSLPREHRDEEDAYQMLSDGARRVAEIAAAGGHHLLVLGPEGSPKSRLARAVRQLLPPLGNEEALQNAMVNSAACTGPARPVFGERPFRAPYLASLSTLFGGGAGCSVAPGELSLANKGVLFMDDLNLVPRSVKDALTVPLEDKEVLVRRLNAKMHFPTDFLLVGGVEMNPECAVDESLAKTMASPLFEHFGLQFILNGEIPSRQEADLEGARSRVAAARAAQEARYEGSPYRTNNEVKSSDTHRFITVSDAVDALLERIVTQLGLSARSYSWLLRVARTIADLEGSEQIQGPHVAEAASYQFLCRHI